MRKTRTVKQEYLICDICKNECHEDADTTYGHREMHFCNIHKEAERIYDVLLAAKLIKTAKVFFDEVKEADGKSK